MPLDAVNPAAGRAISTASADLSARSRLALCVQRLLGWLAAPILVPLLMLFILVMMRWRIEDLVQVRRQFRQIRGEGPLLICANHLTMVDSAIIAWALQHPASYLFRFGELPWNLPEWQNFADQRWKRVAVYLLKCVPIRRGGSREEVRESLNRIQWLLQRGDTVLIFPEGGRSRSGRVNVSAPAHGVGRLLLRVPEARVVCVYMRGEAQHAHSDWPVRKETFRMQVRAFTPATSERGLRASLTITRQILDCLTEMETAHFQQDGALERCDDRQ